MAAAIALILGIILSLTFGNPWSALTKKYTPLLLGVAITGIGAGLNIFAILQAGLQGFVSTVIGIAATLVLGLAIGRFLNIRKNLVLLITAGTAICGGSAIAALAASLEANEDDVSVALGTVFLLNAIGLFLFPVLGHLLQLSEVQFGLWSAIAIHDTSSVVGASMQYGPLALQIATTVKLARALWIVPVTILLTRLYKEKSAQLGRDTEMAAVAHTADALDAAHTANSVNVALIPRKWTSYIKIPWFISGFLIMAVLATAVASYLPDLLWITRGIEFGAKQLFIAALFLIGSNMNIKAVKSVGMKPLNLALMLWVFIAAFSLISILIWN